MLVIVLIIHHSFFSDRFTCYLDMICNIVEHLYTKPWWRHQMETFSALLAFGWEIHRSPVNSPHKGQWRGALMFSLICAWLNGWVNNRAAGHLRRHRAHYDVIVLRYHKSNFTLPSHRTLMLSLWFIISSQSMILYLTCYMNLIQHTNMLEVQIPFSCWAMAQLIL